ncbi:rab-3A-interacting protein [Patella vulgata]|uniref:rab-3A-interacting protein n=1 Tax=Patella vulgata TaxID=6465 RepID=UPI0024A95B2D|nr:rab-3A-interacting protein [Patella vulgata]
MSSETEPVWVRQGPDNTVNSRSSPTSPVVKSNGSPQHSGCKSPPIKVSESPLSARQIRAGPSSPQASGKHPSERRPSSGSSVSSSGSSHSSVSLSRSNSGSNSQPGTPTRKVLHQNLPNVSVISTSSPTGPVSNITSNVNQVPLLSRPDMIPDPRSPTTNSSLQPLSPPVISQTQSLSLNSQNVAPTIATSNRNYENFNPPMVSTPQHVNSAIASIGRSIAHPAFRGSLDESVYSTPPEVMSNGQEAGSSRLPDLVSNGSFMFNVSGHDEEHDQVGLDLGEATKRRPFRHSYSDGVPNRRKSVTMAEAKTQAFTRLERELTNAQKELKLKDEECEKLSKVRYQMEQEVEDLTASLFEEANKMVQDANIKRIHTEKLLEEANQKIEILQAEVVALKQLVLTSTPNSPNKHLHPQIDVQKKEKSISIKPFWKTHRRSTSHHEFTKESRQIAEAQQEQAKIKCKEIDTVCLEEFQNWRLKPEMNHSTPFFCRVFNEDIKPCLNFQNRKLATRLQECVEGNCLTIEPIPGDNSYPRKCSLTESNKLCNYKIRLDDDQEWHSISQLCRNRIAAVCDFYTYIRYIQQGLVKSEDKDAFYEIARLRRQIGLAKLGFT